VFLYKNKMFMEKISAKINQLSFFIHCHKLIRWDTEFKPTEKLFYIYYVLIVYIRILSI